ncbi:BTAD domain-containing putative transcriptional regulator [Spongiactinospora sp. 9N601]|uniref:AfsR/SARP family transcriptional regulator n=1 Tax=Spongiactinospora sp. 9N601 TaxID=3375149 RepID=UPI0037B73E4E
MTVRYQTLQFQLLGPVAVHTGDGRHIEVGERMHRLLLAILLAAGGRPAGTDCLTAALWDDAPPTGAAARIHAHARDLRAHLAAAGPAGKGLLPRNDGAGYRITIPREAVGAHRFGDDVAAGQRALAGGDPQAGVRLLRRALALWHTGGGHGAGVEVPEPVADLKGLWAEDYRRDLLAEYQAAWQLCLTTEVALGRHAPLIPELRALTRARPFDENAAATLMRACYRAGRQGEAMTAYQQLRDRLAEEYGTPPCPQLIRLYDQILHHDPALDTPSPPNGAEMPQHPNPAAPDQAGPRTAEGGARQCPCLSRRYLRAPCRARPHDRPRLPTRYRAGRCPGRRSARRRAG